mmetsp:Transcript_3664/g.9150  ORF Transcript_3664/g.9150 Transcript_3664/m.9150 type:complete len:237 (-) Transcript_3664:39-749(-)
MLLLVTNIESWEGLACTVALFVLLNSHTAQSLLAMVLLPFFLGVAVMLLTVRFAPLAVDPWLAWLEDEIRARAPDAVNQFFRGIRLGDVLGHTRRRKRARATRTLGRLHSEPHRSPADLQALSARELREVAAARGFKLEDGMVDKAELAATLELKDPCAICLDGWRPDGTDGSRDQSGPTVDPSSSDVAAARNTRRYATFLRCGHFFHTECIHQWVESASELGDRPVACPYCNTEL